MLLLVLSTIAALEAGIVGAMLKPNHVTNNGSIDCQPRATLPTKEIFFATLCYQPGRWPPCFRPNIR